jgi:transposase-like protein
MESVKNSTRKSFRTRQERLQLLTEYEQGTQSIKSFCAFHNIPTATFHNWRKNHINPHKDQQPGFATIEVTSASTGLFAEVGRIKIYQPVSAAYLKELL